MIHRLILIHWQKRTGAHEAKDDDAHLTVYADAGDGPPLDRFHGHLYVLMVDGLVRRLCRETERAKTAACGRWEPILLWDHGSAGDRTVTNGYKSVGLKRQSRSRSKVERED